MTQIEFFAEMQIQATEPLTRATCHLGYMTDKGQWVPIMFAEGPSLFTQPECPLAVWLADGTETLSDPDGSDSSFENRMFYEDCIRETTIRLRQMALDIAQGRCPVPEDHSVVAWPVNGVEQIVSAGEFVPGGVTHLRSPWSSNWIEIEEFRQPQTVSVR